MTSYPMVNQLQSFTVDGQPDEDSRMNCVSAALASAMDFKTPYGPFSPDALKDAVYGQGYIGPQSPAHYAASSYITSKGVELVQHTGDGAQLVALLHEVIAKGSPLLGTIPSNWATPYPDPLHPSGSTHVVAFYPDPTAPTGTLSAMNPWGGFRQNQPDSWWAPRLCYGGVWAIWPTLTPLQLAVSKATQAVTQAQAQLAAALADLASATQAAK